ncbi:MAG: hypothetical protein ACO3D0_10120 [Ilumatobacteraceae bacterium]
MQFQAVQRRRAAIAVAVTAIAVPSLLVFGGGDTDPQPSFSTTVGSVVSSDVSSDADLASARPATDGTDPMGTSVSAFLQGSGTLPPAEPATIAIPRLPELVTGTATFRRDMPRTTSCMVHADVGVPPGAEVTVMNRNNSRSVRCLFDITGIDTDDDIVLHPDALTEIGDLTDAPLPVQLTW